MRAGGTRGKGEGRRRRARAEAARGDQRGAAVAVGVVGRRAGAHARHREVDLHAHRAVADGRGDLAARRLLERVALRVEAVVLGVPPHHLVPRALHRRAAHRDDRRGGGATTSHSRWLNGA